MKCHGDTFVPEGVALLRKEFASRWAGQEEIKEGQTMKGN